MLAARAQGPHPSFPHMDATGSAADPGSVVDAGVPARCGAHPKAQCIFTVASLA